MNKQTLTGKLLDLAEGRETPESWRSWWDEHEQDKVKRLCNDMTELLDKEGKVRYAWRNLDTDGEFCSLFRRCNGNHYLIFRTELYGYIVLEVESGQEMHYIPACVHPEEG